MSSAELLPSMLKVKGFYMRSLIAFFSLLFYHSTFKETFKYLFPNLTTFLGATDKLRNYSLDYWRLHKYKCPLSFLQNEQT